MAAIVASIAILTGVLAPVLAFLVIALVSLKGTQPADRAAILRALAGLLPIATKANPRLPGARS